MKLLDLIRDALPDRAGGANNPDVLSIEYDSRSVKPGSLFVAIRGQSFDGTRFIEDAITRGASAVVTEVGSPIKCAVPLLQVGNARQALAKLSWALSHHPERRLRMLAVTGTNGKTTVARAVQHVLSSTGISCGSLGTLGVHYGETSIDTARTTSESADLAVHLTAMHESGCQCCIMEATSIGIALDRVYGIPFEAVLFTNLTHDHLDFHGSFTNYKQAKLRLFREQSESCVSVINIDDPSAAEFIQVSRGPVVTYGIEKPADVTAKNISLSASGTQFDIVVNGRSQRIVSPFIGRFNIYNLLSVIALSDVMKRDLREVSEAIRSLRVVRGRVEPVLSTAPFSVVIDYAHTPDALEKILVTLKELSPRRLHTVVGAGGDRDREKRPIMARVAEQYSDRVYLTSDNPRSEDPESILQDMSKGITNPRSTGLQPDRRKAIYSALASAAENDVVLIAGKGHETYQEIMGVRHPFDDRQVAREWLDRAGFGS